MKSREAVRREARRLDIWTLGAVTTLLIVYSLFWEFQASWVNAVALGSRLA
jgi:hypothetical protein